MGALAPAESEELSRFANAIRECLGLDPLPSDRRKVARFVSVEEHEIRRFWRDPVDSSTGRVPRRGSGS